MNTRLDYFGNVSTHRLRTLFVFAIAAQIVALAIANPLFGAQASNGDIATAVGLVAAYNFDENFGGTTADVSGNGNTGVINGASWTNQGKFGNALRFDGFSNWVTVNDADSLDLSGGMTLEAWIFPTAATGNWATVALKEAPPGNNLAYHLQTDPVSHPISFLTTNLVGLQGVTGPQAVALNAWTHLSATYDGTTLSLYVNGVLAATQLISGNILPSIGPLRFGGNSIWGEYFAGTIDDIRIYNRALNQNEILSDMSMAVAPQSACVLGSGYWQNHSAAWCVNSVQLGCTSYSKTQAISVMRQSSSQDKTYTMAQQLIAAKLNIACRQTYSGCVSSAIAAADTWLCAHPVGSGVRASSAAWQSITASYDAIASFNNGTLCAPICTSN